MAAGAGQRFAAARPAIIADARQSVARRRAGEGGRAGHRGHRVALAVLLRRYPGLALAADDGQARRVPDPATWRLAALPVSLGQPCRASS